MVVAEHARKVSNTLLYEVTDKFVDLIEDHFTAEPTTASAESTHKIGTTESQYQHDFDEFNATVNVIKKNHSIDWVAMKLSFKMATFEAKVAGKTDLFQIAWKHIQSVDGLINNVGRQFLIYQPYKLPHTKFDDVLLLQQYQKAYKSAFDAQMLRLYGESKLWNLLMQCQRKIKEMKDKFETNVHEIKWKALKDYLSELNEFGEATHLPMVHGYTQPLIVLLNIFI